MRGAITSSKHGGRRKKNLKGIVRFCFVCFCLLFFVVDAVVLSNMFLRRRFSENNIGGKKGLFSVWQRSCIFALLTFCADFLGFTG